MAQCSRLPIAANALALGFALSAGSSHAAGTIWQIGELDGGYVEFALAGDFAKYAARFTSDATYRVGRSRPSEDWPYIHPGPNDAWAGSRLHPLRIEFELPAAPKAPCRLNVHLVDSRHESAQVLLVDINGRRQYRCATEPGVGEASLIDASAGLQSTVAIAFPPRWLHAGLNHITLTVAAGSWVLYDAISLESGPSIPSAPVLSGLSAVLGPDGPNGPATINLSMRNSGTEGVARAQVSGLAEARAVRVQPGANVVALALPSRPAAGPLTLTVECGDKRQAVQVQQRTTAWRIGAHDGGYGEFAIAGRYPDYGRAFPDDVTFRVGEGEPARAWPFIHPGPSDAWAGARQHPFRIEFGLADAPTGSAELCLDLVDTQHGGGPVLEVDINGQAGCRIQLPAGAGDDSLTDPRAGRAHRVVVPIAASLLHQGANRITLTLVSGSWMLYDDVSLELGTGLPQEPVVEGLMVASTPLFRRVNGELRQAIRLATRNTGVQGEAEVRLAGATAATQSVALAPGWNSLDVLVPPIAHRGLLTASLRIGDREATARIVAGPERRWRVYIGPSTHTDIGYTDFQERVYERHNENTATALAAASASPSFRWNLEVGYQAELFRQRGPAAFRGLMAQAREGRIGIGGLYLNMLTGLCSGEELVRAVTFVQDLAREGGAVADAANLTDVPTAVGTLPMLLSQSGGRYFVDGANDVLPFQWGGRQVDQQPYWWEGLDGSRVLALTARTYAQAYTLGLVDDVPTVEQRLPDWLRRIGRSGYPCDAAYVNGAFSDNQPMSPKYAEVVAAWNARWDYPRLIVADAGEFFRDVEAHAARRLPVVRGDLGVLWEDGAASSARETASVRQAKAQLQAAERWHALSAALGAGSRFPARDIRAAWDDVLLFDEHTWGAANSVTEPESEQTRRQWAVKAAFADRARHRAAGLLQSGIGALAGGEPGPTPRGGDSVAVLNEHSWPRDIVAMAPLGGHHDAARSRVVGSDGEAVPCELEPGGLAFLACQVPPLGWRVYRIAEAVSQPAPAPLLRAGPDEWSWETPDFRLRIDPATGSLSSLHDKSLRTEWAAGTGGFGLNQLVYVAGTIARTVDASAPPPSLQVSTHTKASVALVHNGPVRAVLRITRTGPQAPPTDTYVILGPGRGVEFLNVMHKAETLSKEAAYFAFPFRLGASSKRAAFVEQPYGVMQVERDQAPGGCRDWYTTNSFAAVSDGRYTAYLATPHAPLLTFNDIFRGRMREHVDPINGAVFPYVLNNYWGTNYKASQGGHLVFSFALRLERGGFDPVKATQFGWDALSTMADPGAGDAADLWIRTARPAVPAGPSMAPEASTIRVSSAKGLVGGITCRHGRLVVRLYNPTAEPTAAAVEVPGRQISEAWLADLVGEPRARLPLAGTGHTARVQVPRRGLATVVLSLGDGP